MLLISKSKCLLKGKEPIMKLSYVYLKTSPFTCQSKPVVSAKEPFMIMAEPGKKYSWCSCGLSQKQPLCDGSHKKTEMRPYKITSEKECELWFCGCKQTRTPPFCDGSHLEESVQKCSLGTSIP
ncbi:CDGSH iron-sulfur domain-containing protein 3, mitochondrial [Hydra vulgaris]|uniref:CDGSH iron-sulfur domain-containing protein 3, mitochondrial n=1 Tax=Hydra vulgaris TaxID=6087 RepID=UPI001F5E51CF|nr:CDGSH iron-sulfur domain-containing protein 3, mitochondrial [Hydra vulgaris]